MPISANMNLLFRCLEVLILLSMMVLEKLKK